jgi:hypothetical protein
MRRTLAVMVLVGLSVCIADASDEPITVKLKDDVRLFNLTGDEPQKVGMLTYYSNVGGGYTFLEHGAIVFYSLPFIPSTCKVEQTAEVNGGRDAVRVSTVLGTIGSSPVPFGGQTIFRSEMRYVGSLVCRDDTSIAKWFFDARDGKFRLVTVSGGEYQTRLKLKSIVPVLEHSGHVR